MPELEFKHVKEITLESKTGFVDIILMTGEWKKFHRAGGISEVEEVRTVIETIGQSDKPQIFKIGNENFVADNDTIAEVI